MDVLPNDVILCFLLWFISLLMKTKKRLYFWKRVLIKGIQFNIKKPWDFSFTKSTHTIRESKGGLGVVSAVCMKEQYIVVPHTPPRYYLT